MIIKYIAEMYLIFTSGSKPCVSLVTLLIYLECLRFYRKMATLANLPKTENVNPVIQKSWNKLALSLKVFVSEVPCN